jgi:hypothetical protein
MRAHAAPPNYILVANHHRIVTWATRSHSPLARHMPHPSTPPRAARPRSPRHRRAPAQSKLGGGEGVEGIYGSITATGMQKIFDCMHHSCALGPRSTLIDIGAGLGR